MPVYNVHPTQIQGNAVDPVLLLRNVGLILPIEIMVPDALASNLTTQGLPVPVSQAGQALIDTGASISGIHEPVAQSLNLQPVGPVMLGGIGGANQHNLYQIKASFPGTPLPDLEWSVAGVNLEGQSKIFLIGMDLLSLCLFTYNGPMGCFTLAF